MGRLLYGSAENDFDFDDRALIHLQIVMSAKLRRHESFVFSWLHPAGHGDGRESIWIGPGIALYFRFFGGRVPTINHEWIQSLTASSNSRGGLYLSDEPKVSSQQHHA